MPAAHPEEGSLSSDVIVAGGSESDNEYEPEGVTVEGGCEGSQSNPGFTRSEERRVGKECA